MKTLALLIVAFIVVSPVILGLAIDSVSYNLFALSWAAVWWLFFSRTKLGKKLFRKGYRIASAIMSDIDV